MNVQFGPAGDELTLVANFGLLRRSAGGELRYLCEEALGGLAWRVRRAGDGAWLVATPQGVLRHEPASCPMEPRLAAVDAEVVDVLAEGPGSTRVWALTAQPAVLYRSDDGGRSFSRLATFAEGEQPFKLLRAPAMAGAAGDRLYVAGEDADGRLLIRWSDDGGARFERPAGAPPPGIPLDLLAVARGPQDTLFAAVRVRTAAGEHEEIWRSRDGGAGWQRSLALPPSEGLGGFALAGATIYAGARELLFGAASAPARLLVSPDGGDSWPETIASPRTGPRFRCLAVRGERLYACGGGEPNGDGFLLGVSADGGRSWAPVMTVADLAGPEPCLRATCLPTTEWLCSTYGVCEGRPRDGGPPGDDGGRGDAGAAATSGGGCGCALGAGSGGPGNTGFTALILAGALARSICHTRRRRWRA